MTAVSLTKAKLKKLETLQLTHGSHSTREDGLCAMEMVAYLAGEPHSDTPKCSCPVLTRFVIRLNDRWSDERRQKLKPFLPRLIGTRSTPEVGVKRAYLAADWSVREAAPMALEAAGLDEWAKKLRELPPIVDKASAEKGRALAREARSAAYAADAHAAAHAAAYAAADAYAAAYAYAAAAAAAYAADAADADAAKHNPKSRLTVEMADAAALSLLERMIAVTASRPTQEGESAP